MPNARPLPGGMHAPRAIDSPLLTPRQRQFLRAALDAGPGATVKTIAESVAMQPAQAYGWLKKSDAFRLAYDGLWREILTSHLPNVMRAIVAKAERGDVPAARLVLDASGILSHKLEVSGSVEHTHSVVDAEAYITAARAALPAVMAALATTSAGGDAVEADDVVDAEVIDADVVEDDDAADGDEQPAQAAVVPMRRGAPSVAPQVIGPDKPRQVLPGGHSVFHGDRT